jgi:hypothetical protein
MARSLGIRLAPAAAIVAFAVLGSSACLLDPEAIGPMPLGDGEACATSECGPALGMPNLQCADGSWGGPTGRCLADGKGNCSWEIRACPAAQPCGATGEGACPATQYCAQGVGECLRYGFLGECHVRPVDCDEALDPVCGCDGATYASACAAAKAGVAVAANGACDQKPCGGIGGLRCPPTMFCDFPLAMCRAVDALGTCAYGGGVCPMVWAPVCGCDGATYPNACSAHAAAVSVQYLGICKGTLCSATAPCAEGTYCKYDEGSCGDAGTFGGCAELPALCPLALDYVCGCDGKSYPSGCAAAQAGTSVAHQGACI